MFQRAFLLSRIALLSAAAMVTPAGASTAFSIAPLGMQMTVSEDKRQVHDSFTLTNTGSEAVTVGASVLAWSQTAEGENKLAASDDFLLYPRSVRLQAGESKNLRLVRRNTAPTPDTQATYRVQFKELAAAPELMQSESGPQVRIVTRVLVPLVVNRKGFTPENRFSFVKQASGLFVRNDGAGLVKLSRLSCEGQSVTGVGTGSDSSTALYGSVFKGQYPSPGAYQDTLTMTVEY